MFQKDLKSVNWVEGCLGAAVARVTAARRPVPVQSVGIRDTYATSGDDQALLEKYGLLPANIVQAVEQVLKLK